MICFFNSDCNSIMKNFWKISLVDFYNDCLETVRNHTADFFLPCIQRLALPDDYIMYETYERKHFKDVRLVKQPDGSFVAEETVIEDFRIQRILLIENGKPAKTQAILPDFFIIYGRFSLRYVLYHLSQFFDKDTSIEDYCLDHSISIPTFTKWLKWLEDNISILREIGLFQDKKENRKTLKEWIHEIKTRSTDWLIKSLRLLNLSLFQRRRMPDNTMYHFLLRSLKN